jgi:hypothetical protein
MKLDTIRSLYCELTDCGGRIADVLADGRILRLNKGQPDVVPVGSSLIVTCSKWRLLDSGHRGGPKWGNCGHTNTLVAIAIDDAVRSV